MILNARLPVYNVPMGTHRANSYLNVYNYEDTMSVEDAINTLSSSLDVNKLLKLISFYGKDLRCEEIDIIQYTTESTLGVDELYLYVLKEFTPYICEVINMVKILSYYYKHHKNKLCKNGLQVDKLYEKDTPAFLFAEKLVRLCAKYETYDKPIKLANIIHTFIKNVYKKYMFDSDGLNETGVIDIVLDFISSLDLKADGKDLGYNCYQMRDFIKEHIPRYYFFENMTPVEAFNLEGASIYFMKFMLELQPNNKYTKDQLNDFIISAEILYDHKHMLYEVFDGSFFERNERWFDNVSKNDPLNTETIDSVIAYFLYRPIGNRFTHRYARKLCVLHNLINNAFNFRVKSPSIDYINRIITHIPSEDDVSKKKNKCNSSKIVNLCKGAVPGWYEECTKSDKPDEDLKLPF